MLMTFFGLFIHYFVRINLSLAIVCMVISKDENSTLITSNITSNLSGDCGTKDITGNVGGGNVQVTIESL